MRIAGLSKFTTHHSFLFCQLGLTSAINNAVNLCYILHLLSEFCEIFTKTLKKVPYSTLL